ncbi:MAG: DHH family phosphoesterase [Candidatus Nanoarchaeia archaeon]|nr:DHH family phosphoesterase [Candidatus Nanoarchaeia archaeon]
MITQKEIEEIRELLKKSKSPLFLYDDDPDGLSSYLLLRKYLGRGKGIVVKSSPALDLTYLKKVKELNPDRIFILDKPIVTQEFVDEAQIPIVWIDHHEPLKLEGIKYFNPRLKDDHDSRCTSYWCNEVAKENDWISAAGIFGDWFLPDNFEELIRKYPDLLFKTKNPGDILFNSEFGKLVKVFSFALKGSTTQIRDSISVLLKIETPYEILNQLTPSGRFLYKRFERVNKEYINLLEQARKKYDSKKKTLVFLYPSNKTSHTGLLSNELTHAYPDTLLIIGREKKGEVRMSIRYTKKKLPPLINKALEGLTGYGGGHDYACGGNVKSEDFEIFIERLEKLIQK